MPSENESSLPVLAHVLFLMWDDAFEFAFDFNSMAVDVEMSRVFGRFGLSDNARCRKVSVLGTIGGLFDNTSAESISK